MIEWESEMPAGMDRRSLLAMTGVSIFSRPAFGNATETINFAYQTGDINVLLMYVVGAKLFEKYDIALKLLPFPAGPQQLPALASGDADIAWMGEFPAVTSFANGLPLQIFLIERVDNGHQRLVANPKSGIQSLADLKGKRIGVSIGATSHYLTMLALSRAGLNVQDVSLVNLTPENMPPAYVSDRIDAAFTWEPNITLIEKAGGRRIASPATLGEYTAGVLVARKQFLDQNADKIQRFLAAWNEGLSAYLRDPREVMPFEAKRLGLTIDELVELVKRQNTVRPTFDEELTQRFMGIPGGASDTEYVRHLQKIAAFLVAEKKIAKTDINWAGLINPGPVAQFRKTHG